VLLLLVPDQPFDSFSGKGDTCTLMCQLLGFLVLEHACNLSLVVVIVVVEASKGVGIQIDARLPPLIRLRHLHLEGLHLLHSSRYKI